MTTYEFEVDGVIVRYEHKAYGQAPPEKARADQHGQRKAVKRANHYVLVSSVEIGMSS